MSVQRRLNVGSFLVLLLFVVLLAVQFVAGPRLRTQYDGDIARADRAAAANDQVLQRMTDAETGVRGFQLTGDPAFLEPYEEGWTGALAGLDEIANNGFAPQVEQLLGREREAVRAWLDGYALPIVTAGVPDNDGARAVEGKRLFDEIRMVGEVLDRVLAAERRNLIAAELSERRLLDLFSAGLVAAILLVSYAVARTARRQLLVPLGDLGRTIRSLAGGNLATRAEPGGAAELRTVVQAVNDLAAQTETLLAAEQARAARAGLRQAVAAEMQEMTDPTACAHRIAELIGAAVCAGAVHCEMVFPGTGTVHVAWPSDARGLAAGLTAEMLAGKPGQLRVRPDGSIWLAIGGDDCAPGYLYAVRPSAPVWTEAEQRLLAGVGREIERAVRQLTVQHQQARLITELRMLDQRKDVFIQTVTHELRTPLTSILGYAEMIADDEGELTAIQQRALDAILRNSHRLHDTIGDLVLLDRPDRGAALHTETLDLADVARMVRGELGNAAGAKNLTVTVDADEGWVRGDRTQLQRALSRLLDNAIKFTPAGGSVECRVTADARTVAVAVTDTGIGIPAEDVRGLFTPFHRAGNAVDQAVQGPGLGLAIVRDIVRDHGGTITVQSVVGRGSTFTVTLPAASASAPVLPPVVVPAEPKSPAHV
ncbi:ATP-binding protein [Actinoplanes sp. NEAU-A12]|uniref:histidine kinase n=1 Tax=Actinoplanes sandaracinus TaxID=3045177 RepID=A0ABT6X212_9ACTN|nr:ATP-binding protein [Actinoplanes sandaracinus]MDI6105860.1 ATP-binding protein [Actinoplanes sandaracinus]